MKITFFRPPFFSIISAFNPVRHFGIAYMSAVLKWHGYETALVDGETFAPVRRKGGLLSSLATYLRPSEVFEDAEKMLQSVMENDRHEYWQALTDKVKQTAPDIIAVTGYTQHMSGINIITRKFKEQMSNIPIILGGVHATAMPVETMRDLDCIDYVIAGEGEYRLLAFCDYLRKGEREKITTIDSIFWRNNGAIMGTKSRTLIEDLDALPFPDRSLGDDDDYRVSTLSSVPVVTGRGCPYNCHFCASKTLWTRKVRYRSAQNIISEIEDIELRSGSRRFQFIVDTMATNKQNFLAFCREVKKYASKHYSFSMNLRVNEVDEEIFEAMKRANIIAMGFGIESGSQHVLDRIEKAITIEQIVTAMRLVNKYGMFCDCNFIIGHPDETLEDVKETITLAEKIAGKTVILHINLATPYPGTPFYELAQKRGYKFNVQTYYKLYHQGNVNVNLSQMSDEDLIYWHKRIQKIFAMHNLSVKIRRSFNTIISKYMG